MKYKYTAEYMRFIRTEVKMTQLEFSNICGVHSQYVSNWERSVCPPPKHTIKKLNKNIPLFKTEFILEAMVEDYKSDLRRRLNLRPSIP